MRTRRSRPAPVARSAFVGFCFPPDVIVLAVRWYLRFALSYRDGEELLAERGIQVDHVTIYRWVQRSTPLLAEAARPCRHAVGNRWGVDETYVKVAGRWRYVYRAIDQFGQVIDVFVLDELLPAAWHRTDRYANNRVECDHGRLKARLRPMRGLKGGRMRIGLTGIWVDDQDRAERFYTQVLGLLVKTSALCGNLLNPHQD
jgi:transposase, IS6 family